MSRFPHLSALVLATAAMVASAAVVAVEAPPAAAVAPVMADGSPAGTVLAADDFERSSGSGWGRAAVGGDWTLTGQGAASVGSGAGVVDLPAPAAKHAEMRSVSSTATRVDLEWSLDRLYQGSRSGVYVAATARQVGADRYDGRLVVGADGGVTLHLLRNFSSVATAVRIPGLVVQPGVRYRLAVQASGTAPTTLGAKVWRAGATEPTTWQVSGTDTTGVLQRAGHVGLFSYVPGDTRNGPVRLRVDSVRAVVPGAPATTPTPTPTPAPAPGTAPATGPVSYPSIEALRASGQFRVPSDARLVLWRFGDQSLEQALSTLGSNDILVLPERAAPYRLDSSGGFRAAGVSAVTGAGGKKIPITSTFDGRPASTWFAMARAERGIIGLGPGAVIEPTASSFRQEAQIEDKGSPLPGGGVSPGRFWYDEAGNKRHELVGSQEKLIESNHASPYFGNFTLRGRDFGGVAYSALATKGGTFERLDLDGAWRGFQGVPNGETAAIAVNRGRYLISRVSMRAVDEQGRRVGSSPLMVNTSPGGRWEHSVVSQARVGMPTIWGSSGLHEVVDVANRWGAGHGINVERAQDGFRLRIIGGSLWTNRGGTGGHPAPDGISGTGMHLALHALGSISVEMRDVDLDHCLVSGAACVQLYGGTDPKRVSFVATRNGQTVPVAAYGVGGRVGLG